VALAVSREQAAALLSVSVDYLDKRVIPDLRVVSKGRKVLIPVRELERWLEKHAAFALKGT
jgi:excisionase family DNA binding protein